MVHSILEKTLMALTCFHENLPEKIVDKNVFTQEAKSIEEYIPQEKELLELIDRITFLRPKDLAKRVNVDGEEINQGVKLLIDLHLNLSNAIWQLEQLEELTIEIIKKYPDKTY